MALGRDTPERDHVEDLYSLAARCGRAAPPARLEVERALEGGFGRLVALEARLQRVQAAENEPAAERESQIASLTDQIEALREALAELQRRVPADPQSYLAPGFVLPRQR
jgi:TolA-binding protein